MIAWCIVFMLDHAKNYNWLHRQTHKRVCANIWLLSLFFHLCSSLISSMIRTRFELVCFLSWKIKAILCRIQLFLDYFFRSQNCVLWAPWISDILFWLLSIVRAHFFFFRLFFGSMVFEWVIVCGCSMHDTQWYMNLM